MRWSFAFVLGLVTLAACGDDARAPVLRAGDQAADPGDGGAATESGAPDAGGEGGVDPTRPRLPDVAAVPFKDAPGSGLSLGIVTGRIYEDLAKNTDDRLRDLAALGVRILRLEIERATPLADYAKIVTAAKASGIEVLALITQASLAVPNDPMAGTRADFDGTFVPKVIAAIDAVTAAIPALKYVEVWNEPDVYAFTPIFAFTNGVCIPKEGAHRYALLTVRVFETMNERRKKGMATPTLVAFDYSHQDDGCVVKSVADAQPIKSHRDLYRTANALPDGLPTDIVSIHGYGLPNRIPGEAGYTYAGGTFADGVTAFLGSTFADGKKVIGAAPVWYSEVGFCLSGIGGPDPLNRQGQAVTGALTALRSHPEITAAFLYSYRDDEGQGGERCGLRDSSTTAFKAHPAYTAAQAQAVAGKDEVAPGGAFEVMGAKTLAAGAAFEVRGWAIDADGLAPSVSIAIDGAVVATVVDGASPNAAACTIASSTRCPNVGFAKQLAAPSGSGAHEIAARATDAKGNARILGRTTIVIQ